MNTRAVCLLTGFLLAACGEGAPTGTPEVRSVGEQRLETRAIFSSPVFHSGANEASRLVVRSDAPWREIWAQIHSRQQPVPAVPAVDFGREMVVVAAMGSRPTGGYAIRVDSATSAAGTIHVFLTERSPGRSCVTLQAFTAPVDAVVVPDDGRAVRFHETKVVHTCG